MLISSLFLWVPDKFNNSSNNLDFARINRQTSNAILDPSTQFIFHITIRFAAIFIKVTVAHTIRSHTAGQI